MEDAELGIFPNIDHKFADATAERRAKTAIQRLEQECLILRQRIDNGTIEGDDSRRLAETLARVIVHTSELETLRNVRTWDATARKEAKA